MNKTITFIIAFALIALITIVVYTNMNLHEEEFSGETRTVTFAGGCFWCMEAAFQELPGVVDVVSGYTGGHTENPTYEQVTSGTTGHYEAVEIKYDPNKITYPELVDYFWKNIDPTDQIGQFSDKGDSYRTAIFYHDDLQKEIAEKTKLELENSGKFDKEIATKILPFEKFWKAEEYHQDYYKKKILQYKAYEKGSGRKETLKEIWKE